MSISPEFDEGVVCMKLAVRAVKCHLERWRVHVMPEHYMRGIPTASDSEVYY